MLVVDNSVRNRILFRYGFGTEIMKDVTVCKGCGSLESVSKIRCSQCGKILTKSSLYDVYKSQHKLCVKCGVVLSDSMFYCPKCGVKIEKSNGN